MGDHQIQIIFQLVLAIVLGAITGLERERKGKEAGFQTYSLVSLGACLFTIISLESFNLFNGNPNVGFDPSRIIMAVASGIGFIGAGVIIFRQDHIKGVTTAAGLWCVAAIGVAIGFQFYLLASFAAVFALIILSGFAFIENKVLKK